MALKFGRKPNSLCGVIHHTAPSGRISGFSNDAYLKNVDEYIENHIKWFLKNHQNVIPQFIKTIKNIKKTS